MLEKNNKASANNKRIAKNTIALYFRMIFLMIVTLYTSRVTLQILGVNDYGIYNIVGGVVVLFSFISTALNTACNRFLSVSVGKGDVKKIQKTFSTALVAHVYLTIIVAILLETIGLWFVTNKLNIPQGRDNVISIVYHLAVLTTCFNILRTPFNASILANEKMDFYAYTSIAEGLLKLFVVWILVVIPYDKLVMYSVLTFVTILVINLLYIWYCRNKLEGNRFVFVIDKGYMKEMVVFSGWSMFGGIADIGWQQGTNIILNIFYGVSLNATMGITNQVRNAVYSFVANLQAAANPQIIKSYSNGNLSSFYTLIYAVSKYSFYLMLFFSIPIIANINYILTLWLGVPPNFTNVFSCLILIFSNIAALGGPLWICIQATGDVKSYSLIVSCILLLNLPVTYLLFANGCSPETMLVARILILLVQTTWMVWYAERKVGLNICHYINSVVRPILYVTFIAISAVVVICYIFNDGFIRLLSTVLSNTIVLIFAIYFLGINSNERSIIDNNLKIRFHKK